MPEPSPMCVIADCHAPAEWMASDLDGHWWTACDRDREAVETITGLHLMRPWDAVPWV